MAYCTITDVQSLNPKRTYGATTTPSTTQVNSLIDLIYGQINTVLESQGYTTPVTEPASLVTALQLLNAQGAAAMSEMGMFSAQEKGSTPHWKVLWEAYQDGLESLRKGQVPQSLGKGGDALNAGSLYTAADTDQDDYPEPVFSIDPDSRQF